MRPLEIDKIFKLSADFLICLYGGLVSPKLCGDEIKEKLKPYNFLISFDSTVGEETHLSKERYFEIVSSSDNVKEIVNTACCLISIHAFENLKKFSNYRKIKDIPSVRFLNHLRNSSAHGNTFHFLLNGKFLPPKLITWNGKTIDVKLQGKPVFPDFISPGDLAYLFEDISIEIKKYSE